MEVMIADIIFVGRILVAHVLRYFTLKSGGNTGGREVACVFDAAAAAAG